MTENAACEPLGILAFAETDDEGNWIGFSKPLMPLPSNKRKLEYFLEKLIEFIEAREKRLSELRLFVSKYEDAIDRASRGVSEHPWDKTLQYPKPSLSPMLSREISFLTCFADGSDPSDDVVRAIEVNAEKVEPLAAKNSSTIDEARAIVEFEHVRIVLAQRYLLPYLLLRDRIMDALEEESTAVPRGKAGRPKSEAKAKRKRRIKALAKTHQDLWDAHKWAEIARIAEKDPFIKELGEPVNNETVRNVMKPRGRRKGGTKSR